MYFYSDSTWGYFWLCHIRAIESFCFCAHLVVCCFVGVTPLPCTPCTPDTRFPQTPGVHTAHDGPFSVRARAHPRASVSVPRSFVSDRGSGSRRQAGRSHVWREGGGSRGRRRPRWARQGIRTGRPGCRHRPAVDREEGWLRGGDCPESLLCGIRRKSFQKQSGYREVRTEKSTKPKPKIIYIISPPRDLLSRHAPTAFRGAHTSPRFFSSPRAR